MLDVKHISVRYGKHTVLKDISFSLARGEMVSIVGINGAGKTSLLKSILQIRVPQNGDVFIDGKNVRSFSPKERATHLAYVPQQHPFVFSTSVFETVLMGRRPHMAWRPSKRDIEKTAEILAHMKLDELAHKDIQELSSGQRQRVQLATALAQEAQYLLLDEPTSNLDIYHQLDVMHQIRRLAKEKNMGMLVALHDLNLAGRFSDRIVMMKDGHIFKVGTSDEILTSKNIRCVYDVDAKVGTRNDYFFVQPIACANLPKEIK